MALISLLVMASGSARPQAASQERADSLAGPPPGGVAGRVMNERGEALTGAKVVIHRGDLVKSTRTDDQGEYCFCRLAAARDYVLEIELEGFAGFVERDFTVSKSRIAIRNVILDPLSEFHLSSGEAKAP